MPKRLVIILTLFVAVFASCAEIEPAGGQDGQHELVLHARLEGGPGSKAAVASDGIVSWENTDQIAVYTSSSVIKTLECRKVVSGVATFSCLMEAGESPQSLAMFPVSAFGALQDGIASVLYPSEYDYLQDQMLAPMAAIVQSGTLNFRQVGAMVRICCDDVPSQAVALYLDAPQRQIAGEFSVAVADRMTAVATESQDGNTVKVNFPSRTASIDFNVPVPTGSYPSISARFVDSSGKTLLEWEVLNNVEISRADMFLRDEPDMNVINGTVINEENNRYGLVSDVATGKGISGVPVTDGYTYTVTDENGVYQFVANALSRAVYPSVPADYEIPVSAEDGQPAFWKTEKGRNDFALTPRAENWEEFNILGISDVHFYVLSKTEFQEREKYRTTALADINAYIAGLGNVIAINTGDITSNHTRALADTRAEFALIKKNGVTVPMLHAIGNHDYSNDLTLNSTYECSADYFNVFGPTEYSVNVGKAHIVFLNNIIYAGHDPAGYGKAMQCDFGITDEIYAWLQEDLSFVEDKQDKILILCVHAPIFNNQHQNYGNLREILKTFGEAHIMSGHDHHNIRREYSDSWKGLGGRIPEEHNMPPLGNYWLNDYTTAGVPNGYHVFRISGARMTEQRFKATGMPEADCQFRVYDSSAEYHAPIDQVTAGDDVLVDKDGQIFFDWESEFENEPFDKDRGVVVRVFDAGTRALDCKVWFVQDGVRNEMTRVENTHRDQWSFCYLWFNGWQNHNFPSAYHRGRRNQNFWYYELPSGTLSSISNWKVEVELNGRTFESSTISTLPGDSR